MSQKNEKDQTLEQLAAASQPPEDSKLSYEKATADLEAIVHRLESGELSLEQSVELFQQGMNLAKVCTARLNEIEAKITQLIEKSDGQVVESPFGVNEDD